MKKLSVIILFLTLGSNISFGAQSYTPGQETLNCYGVPDAVKRGEVGSQEGNVIVNIDGYDYTLGLVTDDYAKASLSIAEAALLSGKTSWLRFWRGPSYSTSTCIDMSSGKIIPNSVYIARQ